MASLFYPITQPLTGPLMGDTRYTGGWYPLPGALVDADFLNWRTYDGSTGTPDDKLTYSYTNDTFRTRFNGSLALEDFTSGVLRRSYRYGTSAALVERPATNLAPSTALTGAVAGTPGTLPNGWAIGNGAGLTRTISLATINGIDYIRMRFAGTASTANGLQIGLCGPTEVSAVNGDVLNNSPFLALQDGDAAITAIRLNYAARTSGGTFVAEQSGSNILPELSTDLKRFSYDETLGGGGTVARVQHRLTFAFPAVAVDFTIDIAYPQLEKAVGATSTIKTTGAAKTRNGETLTKTISGTSTGSLVLVARRNETPSGVYACAYSGSGKILVRNNSAGTGIEVVGWNGSTIDTNLTWAIGSRFNLVVSWTGTSINILHTGSAPVSSDLGSSFTPTLLAIGHDWNGSAASAHANADIERVAVANG